MSATKLTDALKASGTAHLGAPPGEAAAALIDSLDPPLPPFHGEVLALANGISSYHGFKRLFGVGCGRCIDLPAWNRAETWKFAWDRDLSGFLFIGESAWGDQYAYDREELRRSDDPKVYRLDCEMMEPSVWAQSFKEFAEYDLMVFSARPFDSMAVEAHKRFGPLPWDTHLAYAPSLILGGKAGVEHMVKLPAVSGMIIAGDIYTQSHEHSLHEMPQSMEPYTDEQGRMRVRLRWADVR